MAKAKLKSARLTAEQALVIASETCTGKAMVDERCSKLERHREMQLRENDAACTALDRLDSRITELVKTVDVLRKDELNNATAIARLQERSIEQGLMVSGLLNAKLPAKPADVSVRVMPVDELIEYIKLHYSGFARAKLMSALMLDGWK